MRIIKLGHSPEDRLIVAKCNNCECEFEFKQSEGDLGTDRNENYISIDCPFCHKVVFTGL